MWLFDISDFFLPEGAYSIGIADIGVLNSEIHLLSCSRRLLSGYPRASSVEDEIGFGPLIF